MAESGVFAFAAAACGDASQIKSDPQAASTTTANAEKDESLSFLKKWNQDTWVTHDWRGLPHVQVISSADPGVPSLRNGVYRFVTDFVEVHPASEFPVVERILRAAPRHEQKKVVWFTESFLRLVRFWCHHRPRMESASGSVTAYNILKHKYDAAFFDQWETGI